MKLFAPTFRSYGLADPLTTFSPLHSEPHISMLTHAAHTSYMLALATTTEAFCVFGPQGYFYGRSHIFEVVKMLPFSSDALMRRGGRPRFSTVLSFFSRLCISPNHNTHYCRLMNALRSRRCIIVITRILVSAT